VAPRPIADRRKLSPTTKTNSDTENKRNEFLSENVDNDVEIRAVDPRSSFTEGSQEIDIQNNSDSESKDESASEEPNLDKTNDPSTNNIIKIRDNLFIRTDSINICNPRWRTM